MTDEPELFAGPDAVIGSISIVRKSGEVYVDIDWDQDSISQESKVAACRAVDHALRKSTPAYGKIMQQMDVASLAGFALPEDERVAYARAQMSRQHGQQA